MHSDSTPEIPFGYCQCGCGNKTNIAIRNHTANGHVKGEPYRFLPNHHRRKPLRYVIEDRGYVTPCWTWQLAANQDGYGRIEVEKRKQPAHVWYYEQKHGPIPAGMHSDHLCRNRDCVNPDHIEVVTPRVNILRGVSPAAINILKTHCKHGHEFTIENTIVRARGKYVCRECRECGRIAQRAYQLRKVA